MKTWHPIEDGLPDLRAGKYKIRRRNGVEMDAFYYIDKMAWIAFYGQKLSYWWNAQGNHERLDDVTHWRERERNND